MNKTSIKTARRGWAAGIFSGMLFLGFFNGAMASPLPVTVFSENFNDGDLAGWTDYNASLWSNPGTELQNNGLSGGLDWAYYGTSVLPLNVFSVDMDVRSIDADPGHFAGIAVSSALGGSIDRFVEAGWETSSGYPGFYKARITVRDSVGGITDHYESSGTDMLGATSFHLELQRALGSNSFFLEVSTGTSTQTISSASYSWVDNLQYIGAFREQGANGYDNLLLTTAVPEPGSLALLAGGLAALGVGLWRKRTKSSVTACA